MELLFTFPPEAAEKIEDFNSTRGEAKWNGILQNFEYTLGCLPTNIVVKGAKGSVQLPTRVHAGIK